MRRLAAACLVAAGLLAMPAPASGEARTIDDGCPARIPEDGFPDIPADNGHEPAVDCIVWWEITLGTASGNYEPARSVTRAQMASFVARLVDRSGVTFPTSEPNAFDDDDRGFAAHEASIDRLAAAGIVQGTGPRRYSPGRAVTRAQMATFLVRAYQFIAKAPLPSGGDAFSDDDGDPHEANINRAAAAGFAAGSNGRFRPGAPVRRDEMGSFLARVLDLMVDSGVTPVPVDTISFSGDGDATTSPFRLRTGDYRISWNFGNPDCSYVMTASSTNEERPGSIDVPDDGDGDNGFRTVLDLVPEEYVLRADTTVSPAASCPWTITLTRVG